MPLKSGGPGVEPAPCYWKVAGSIPPVYWRYWTPNCCWRAGQHHPCMNVCVNYCKSLWTKTSDKCPKCTCKREWERLEKELRAIARIYRINTHNWGTLWQRIWTFRVYIRRIPFKFPDAKVWNIIMSNSKYNSVPSTEYWSSLVAVSMSSCSQQLTVKCISLFLYLFQISTINTSSVCFYSKIGAEM